MDYFEQFDIYLCWCFINGSRRWQVLEGQHLFIAPKAVSFFWPKRRGNVLVIKIHCYKFFRHLCLATAFVSTDSIFNSVHNNFQNCGTLSCIEVYFGSRRKPNVKKTPYSRLETIRLGKNRLFSCWRERLILCREFNDANKQFKFLKRSKKLFPWKAMLLLMS